jgi:hypothetical protein
MGGGVIKETVMTAVNVLQHLLGEVEENHVTPPSGTLRFQ